ncbi:COX19 [Symbiodinium pilosum]|uniref:COX19 protein n=1 Tax=Symbiodinium pilosum TaxID=2952 RepID=A0A812TQH3_SYMPI|nr:COX19 [Symbiodinium pilosum]
MSEVSMGKRIMPGRPPDKGSFPLDHFSECSKLKDEYLQCLKQHSHDNMSCRYLSKRYLQCRMDKNLMTKEPMHQLGFTEEEVSPAPARKKEKKKSKEETGWIVGIDGIKPERSNEWRRPTLVNIRAFVSGAKREDEPS